MASMPHEKRLKILGDLDTQGYAVIADVISHAECDELAGKYKTWLSAFDEGDYPKNHRSIIHGYGVSHMDPTWQIRLKAKPVYEAIYGTSKLLTSTDGIGLLPPAHPDVKTDFDTGIFWCHCDQNCNKAGCHAFQGAVYLEETTPDDYCLRVLKGSHRQHQAFFNHPGHTRAKNKSQTKEFCKLTKAEMKWYLDQGCDVTPLGVPKGGMVLWDSRTIHDTKRPSKNRENPNRWRMLAFVSMAPAFWTTRKDLDVKEEAYEKLKTTAHWASRGCTILRFMGQGKHSNPKEVCLSELPHIAKTKEVRQMVGVEPYDLKDGEPNGPPAPKMIDEEGSDRSDSHSLMCWLPPDQSETVTSSDGLTDIAARADKNGAGPEDVDQDHKMASGDVDEKNGVGDCLLKKSRKRKADDGD